MSRVLNYWINSSYSAIPCDMWKVEELQQLQALLYIAKESQFDDIYHRTSDNRRIRHQILEVRIFKSNIYTRGFTKFGVKVLWRLQFLEYLRTLSLKFQKSQTKIEVVLTLPCSLSQLRSSNTPETIAFTRPWYLEVWKILHPLIYI